MKINVISPVHIGTGNMLGCICYCETGNRNIVDCFDPEEVTMAVPAEMYLDDRYLRLLSSNQNSNNERYERLMEKIDYGSLKPRYQLNSYGTLNYSDTSEQLKNLNKPYIPGSTIKGAVMHALLYRYVKENYNSSGIEDFILEARNVNRLNIENLYTFIFNIREAYKTVAGFLLCEDVFFEKLGLYNCYRINAGKERKDMPLPNCEAVLPGQQAGMELFSIQSERIKIFMDSGENKNNKVVQFLNHLEKEYILDSLSVMAKDNIEMEMRYHHDIPAITKQLQQLNEISGRSTIIRIGGYTNYWEKSISLLVRKNNPSFYKQYFKDKFSPRGDKANAENMPKTRVILEDDNGCYLAGYLEITDEQ